MLCSRVRLRIWQMPEVEQPSSSFKNTFTQTLGNPRDACQTTNYRTPCFLATSSYYSFCSCNHVSRFSPGSFQFALSKHMRQLSRKPQHQMPTRLNPGVKILKKPYERHLSNPPKRALKEHPELSTAENLNKSSELSCGSAVAARRSVRARSPGPKRV